MHVDYAYLSRVERGLAPASEQLVRRAARVLGVEVEPLLIAAGHLPSDVRFILAEHAGEAARVLREEFAPYLVRRAHTPGSARGVRLMGRQLLSHLTHHHEASQVKRFRSDSRKKG